MKQNKFCDTKQKAKIISKLVMEDESLDTLAKKYEVDKDQILKWRDEVCQNIESAFNDDIEKKDHLFLQQSKLAQMGEMIGMIAHQWRQPLNAISAEAINLSMMSELNELKEEDVQKSCDFIQKQCQKMSETINSFMNFVKQEKQKKGFIVQNVVQDTIAMLEAQFKSRNISLEFEDLHIEEIKLIGYRNLLEQVLLTIFSNARDAFEERKIEKSCIKTTINKFNNIIKIVILDNAGGIEPIYRKKIFNAYFTTKEPGKGTGLGLHMAKRIITEQFNGNIYYEPVENGSSFIIDIKIMDEL